MSGLLLVLTLNAYALEPFDYWESAYDAALRESLDGDLEAAEDRYEDLVHNVLPSGVEMLAITLFRLGRVRYLLGDINGARDTLDSCIATGLQKVRCFGLRGQIDLEADAVHDVPMKWTFDDAQHGFLHPRTHWDKGSIRIRKDPLTEAGSLEWSTHVDAIREDMLVVGFRSPRPTPREVRLTMLSREIDATVRLEFEDIDGRRYVPLSRTNALPRGEEVDVRLALSSLRSVDSDDPPLNARELHRMYIIDVTGVFGQVGHNVLRLDNFQVR